MVNMAGTGVSFTITATDRFSKTFTRLQMGMKSLQKALPGLLAIGGGIAFGLGKAVKVAMDFESAFTGVRKTVELSEAEFEKLRQNFKDLSKEIPVTFVELSKIGEIAGQLGVSGVNNITKFTETIAGIAVTTNLTAEQAATDFARFANIMKMPIDQVDRLSSVVVGLGNNFATTEGELVEMGMRIAGAGAALEFSEGQVMAWAAALSSVGVEAQMGGTAISKMMINISSMVSNGSEDLEGFAEVAGMTSEEFTKAFKEDASGALQTFFVGLGKVKENGGDVLQTLEKLDIKEVRLRDTVLRLSGSTNTLNDALGMEGTLWKENTAAVEEAEKRYATTESQVDILKNKFDSLKDDMGKALIPAFIGLVDILGKLVGWLEKHPTLTKFAVAALAIGSALAVVVGPLIILIAILPAFAAGIGLVSAGFVSLTAAALPVLVPILAIIAALALAIAAYKAFKKFFGKEEDKGTNFKSEKDGTIFLNATKKQAKEHEVIALNDFILTSSGKIIKPSPQDTIIGTKHPESLSSGTTIIVQGNITGVDPDDMADAFATKLDKIIRL